MAQITIILQTQGVPAARMERRTVLFQGRAAPLACLLMPGQFMILLAIIASLAVASLVITAGLVWMISTAGTKKHRQ